MLPHPVRDWAALTANMADYLPDERGLDVPDAHLLNLLTEEGRTGREMEERFPRPREPGWGVLCSERLLELSGAGPFDVGSAQGPHVVPAEVHFRSGGRVWDAHFRITPFGSRVRAGEADVLTEGHFFRWVGGRLITNSRPLRRQRGVPTAQTAVADGGGSE